jgi:hypothetical protein
MVNHEQALKSVIVTLVATAMVQLSMALSAEVCDLFYGPLRCTTRPPDLFSLSPMCVSHVKEGCMLTTCGTT